MHHQPNLADLIQAIVMDLDGTINTSTSYYNTLRQHTISYIAKRKGISRAEAEKLLLEAKKKLKSTVKAIESLGISRYDYHREMAACMDVFKLVPKDPSFLKLIQTLKSFGFKLGVLSNTGRELVLKVLQAKGCEIDFFDVILTSDETELKPSTKPYLLICQRLNVSPEYVLYVGDRLELELEPASKVGMKTVLVKSSLNLLKGRTTVMAIESIYELRSLIKELAEESLLRKK